MLLHTTDVGRGDKTALLLHGLMGSTESWWRVIPLLVDRGYRVLAMDLPGHGLSPRDPDLTVAKAAASVAATLREKHPQRPLHALGHSYGATVLAAATIDADVTVYVDSALSFTGGHDRAQLTARYESDRRNRQNTDWLRSTRPIYTARDAEVEARAAARFDPATSASIIETSVPLAASRSRATRTHGRWIEASAGVRSATRLAVASNSGEIAKRVRSRSSCSKR